MDREERKRLGSLGTEFCKDNLMTSKAMGQRFIDSMNGAFDNGNHNLNIIWKQYETFSSYDCTF